MLAFESDYNYFRDVLAGKPTDRPVMFEAGVHDKLYEHFAGDNFRKGEGLEGWVINTMWAHKNAGYDCIKTSPRSAFHFTRNEFKRTEDSKSISWNDNPIITDWEDLEKYPWPWPGEKPMDILDLAQKHRVDNMGIVVSGSCGLIENAIVLAGYDNLCLKIYDDPDFVEELFRRIGERVYEFYLLALQHPATDCIMMNDDWGFRNQTFFSPEFMRKYAFPWHKKVADKAREAGKQVILHACGNCGEIWEDIIEDIGYDGKHSFEDVIVPVEQVYESFAGRIGILGGIDVDFLARSSPDEIGKRCRAMLGRTMTRGGYALGSGNSVPYYVPAENYLAMINSVKNWNG
jgi:uroporphyrinogen decarboxylase